MRPFRPMTIIILLAGAVILLMMVSIQEIKLNQPSQIKSLPAKANTINILTATKLELTLLPGIGHRLAERLVAYRDINTISVVDELLNIKGIGPTLLERIKPYITIQSAGKNNQ